MEQHITIPKNIVNYFYNELTTPHNTLEVANYQKCYELLKENFFVSDKDKKVLKELESEIESISNTQIKLDFKRSLGNLFVDRVKVLEDHTLENSKLKYFTLCNASEDKIYFDPEFQTEELGLLKLSLFNAGLNDVELNTVESFLKPDEKSRLNHNRIINFVRGKDYKLDEILKPFVREAKNVKIIDNFVANKNALFHFRKLLKKIDGKARIELVTLSKKDYLDRKTDKDFAEKNYSQLIRLKEEYKIDLTENEGSGHLERYIVTDKYEISLPGGFDQFNSEGYPIFKNESSILKMVITDKINSKIN